MENISKLLSTEHYAFNDGDVLYADAMQGIREKINELVEAFNTLFGNGGSSSGGNGNSGSGSQNTPYIYMAAQMTVAGEDSPVRDYEGEVYSPTSETKLVVETLLGAGGSNDDVNEWFVYDMYNAQPNIANAAGIIRFNTEDISQPLQSIRTWFSNVDLYNLLSQLDLPGKYLGNDYVFDCRTEVYDTNYGILCYMSDDNGWITNGDNINGIVPTKVPTKFQIYNDPDTYGGTFIDKENYLLPDLKNVTYRGTEKPIIESSHVSGSYPDDISINNAILMRSVFKYGGSNCIIDPNSKWTIPYFYIYPRKNEEGAYIDELDVDMGLNNYYKLKLSDEENTEWETTGIDTFARVQHKAVVAQHDFLLGLIIGIIREKYPAANDGEGETWTKLKNLLYAAEIINDCLLNDYDPRMRYIWQIRNKAAFQSILLQCIRSCLFGANPNTLITVYRKQSKNSPGQFLRITTEDAVVDCIAEHLLEFLGPKMPWESSFSDPNDPNWGVSVSLDNNVLSTEFEIYNGTYAGQGYDAFLDWWNKKVQNDFDGDLNNVHDTISFNGANWRKHNPKGAKGEDQRAEIKSTVQGADGTKSAIRNSFKDILKNIISRGLDENSATEYAVANYDHALRAHYKYSDSSEWNKITGSNVNEIENINVESTEWTIEKYRHFVYYKNNEDKYQYIYTCAKDNQIKFFIFKTPTAADEGVYSYGKMSSRWKDNVKNWYNHEDDITFLDPNDHSNWYLKRFHSWDCDYDNTFDKWTPVIENEKEVFRVLQFIDTYGLTTSPNKLTYSYCIENTYSNGGNPDLDVELSNACSEHWVDVFGQGPLASGSVNFLVENRIYGYIIEGSNDNAVSIGQLNCPYNSHVLDGLNCATLAEVTAAAYSWAQLLTRSGLHFSTKPLVDEVGTYRNLNLKLQQLSLLFYEELTKQEQQRLEPIKTQLFGQLQDVYFGSNNKYIFNTFKKSITENDDIMTRLSKAYVTKDWAGWLDLRNLYFVEGPCIEGQGTWQESTETRESNMPGMVLNKGDILVALRNVESINNNIIGDLWIDDDGVFGPETHTTLSWGTDTLSGFGGDLSLDVIGTKNFDLRVTIPDQEEVEIPEGMPGYDPNPKNNKYGRFGGEFQLGAVKADAKHIISKLNLNTLYPYNEDQDFNMEYGTAKINVRGYLLDRIDNLPSLY